MKRFDRVTELLMPVLLAYLLVQLYRDSGWRNIVIVFLLGVGIYWLLKLWVWHSIYRKKP